MPTALLKDHMPAGLTDLESVPTLWAQTEENDYEERLAEYVRAIQATSSVFSVANQKTETLVQNQGNNCSPWQA